MKPFRQSFIGKPKFVRPDILCHPNIPKPMHGISPREIMGKQWWNEQRVKIYTLNNQCCFACGVHKYNAKDKKWLEAHEVYDINYTKGLMIFKEIVALCHYCHNFIHNGRLEVLKDKGQITESFYNKVIKHGRDIIKNNGLVNKYKRRHPNDSDCATWEKWRMVFNGIRYKPKFKSFEEWMNHFNPEVEDEEEYEQY